ncbi:hypothetical protein CBL_05552 [Carabus blaptoides fortunei]
MWGWCSFFPARNPDHQLSKSVHAPTKQEIQEQRWKTMAWSGIRVPANDLLSTPVDVCCHVAAPSTQSDSPKNEPVNIARKLAGINQLQIRSHTCVSVHQIISITQQRRDEIRMWSHQCRGFERRFLACINESGNEHFPSIHCPSSWFDSVYGWFVGLFLMCNSNARVPGKEETYRAKSRTGRRCKTRRSFKPVMRLRTFAFNCPYCSSKYL